MSINFDENLHLDHIYLHENIDIIIANGDLPQYYPAIKIFVGQEKCLRCCSLILKNYPAVELWMHWTGFNQIEEQIFHDAVEYGDPDDIFSEYKDGYQHWPLLFRAVSNQHISLVKKIIERCPKVLEHVCDNDNVFSFAINLDRNEIVNYLLDLFVDVKYRKYLKLGPREFVTACNRIDCPLDVIKRLLDVVFTQYNEDEWKEDFVKAIQMMIFKHLNELPALLTYFCQKYPRKTPVLYEKANSGEVLLFSIAVDQSSILVVLENDEKAIQAIDKNGKTLLIRAIEVQNLELVQLLLSPKYNINVNEKDNFDKTPLCYAISMGNPFVIQCLLEHGAKINHSAINDEKIESHVIRCDDEEIINFAISTLNGSIDIKTFTNVLNCLYNSSSGSKWPWFRRNNTRKLFFPSLTTTKDKAENSQMIVRFNEIYKILVKVKITNRCENIFDMFFLDPNVTFEQKEFVAQPGGFLQIQMGLMMQEPYLEYPCEEMYYSKEFNLIKDYLSIESFNEVAEGRELPSLKRFCRSVIRYQIVNRIIEKKMDQLKDFDVVFVDLFDSLPIPKQLKRFLRYQY